MGNKVFIIQSMNGKSEEEIKAERYTIEAKLREWGYDPICSYFDEDAPEGACAPVYYLGRSIELLSHANYIYTADGWERRTWLPN